MLRSVSTGNLALAGPGFIIVLSQHFGTNAVNSSSLKLALTGKSFGQSATEVSGLPSGMNG